MTDEKDAAINDLSKANQVAARTIDRLGERIAVLEPENHLRKLATAAAYEERDKLVAALSKLFPAHLARHPDSDQEWDDEWRWIVFVGLPTGQVSWHIHDRELEWFDHLARKEGNPWDGHTTEEKYERLQALGQEGSD